MIIKKLFFTYGLIIFIALTSNCDLFTNEDREVCGNISVARQIEDVTLSVDDEPILIDVLSDPPVFLHSEGRSLSIRVSVIEGTGLVDTDILINPETGNSQIVEINGIRAGKNLLAVSATDVCGEMDFFVSTQFEVTVTN